MSTTVDKVQDEPFSTNPIKATVLLSGKFATGRFTGKVHLGDSSCPEASCTAHYSSKGGGSAG